MISKANGYQMPRYLFAKWVPIEIQSIYAQPREGAEPQTRLTTRQKI